jgi:hypothetical protein
MISWNIFVLRWLERRCVFAFRGVVPSAGARMKLVNSLVAFAVTAIGAALAISSVLPGVAREATTAPACATATWPQIPADCLVGGVARPVRNISLDNRAAETQQRQRLAAEASDRFATAFQ